MKSIYTKLYWALHSYMNRSYWIFVQLSVVQPRATRKGGKVLQVFPSEEQNLSENVRRFVQNTEDKNKRGGFSDTRTFKFKDATSNQSTVVLALLSVADARRQNSQYACIWMHKGDFCDRDPVFTLRSVPTVGPRATAPDRGNHQTPDRWRITGLIPAAPAFEGEFASRSCFSVWIFSPFS